MGAKNDPDEHERSSKVQYSFSDYRHQSMEHRIIPYQTGNLSFLFQALSLEATARRCKLQKGLED